MNYPAASYRELNPQRLKQINAGVYSWKRAFKNLRQNQTGKMIGLFCVIGIFKGYIADRRYELSQRGMDPVVITVYFHVASFHLEKTGTIRNSF